MCEGDCVSVTPEEPNVPLYIARVISLWEEAGDKYFHACWFSRGGETVLGETSDPSELFLVDSCEDIALSAVIGKVSVQYQPIPSDWRQLGGKEEDLEPEVEEEGTFFFQKWYDPDTARFEDAPLEYLESSTGACYSCARLELKVNHFHCSNGWGIFPIVFLARRACWIGGATECKWETI